MAQSACLFYYGSSSGQGTTNTTATRSTLAAMPAETATATTSAYCFFSCLYCHPLAEQVAAAPLPQATTRREVAAGWHAFHS